MARNDPIRLVAYVRAISRKHGGLQGLKEALRKIADQRAELESLESTGDLPQASADRVEKARQAIENIERDRPLSGVELIDLEAIIDRRSAPGDRHR